MKALSLLVQVMAKFKFFQKQVKSQGQGHEVKNFGIDRKVLSQEIHMWNMKALSLLVQKLWPKLSSYAPETIFSNLCIVTLTFDLLSSKSIGHILASWGVCMWSFMDRYKGKTVMRRKPFSVIYALWPWPFDLKIYRAHPCLMGSLHVKFHDDRNKGKAVMHRKPFSVIYALWPWPLTFWPQNL